ncbi:MAG: hypothetical protein ABFC34_03305 [Methanobacterium sp.]
MITAKQIFKKDKRVTVEATFTEKALEQLLLYYQAGIDNKMHNLTQAEFIGWMAATGTTGLIKGEAAKQEEKRG